MFGMKEILGWRLGAKWVLGLRQVRVMPSKYQTIFNTLLQSTTVVWLNSIYEVCMFIIKVCNLKRKWANRNADT